MYVCDRPLLCTTQALQAQILLEVLVALKAWLLRKYFVTLHFLKYPSGYNFSSNFILVSRVQNTSISA